MGPVLFTNPVGASRFEWAPVTSGIEVGLNLLRPAKEQTGSPSGPAIFGQLRFGTNHAAIRGHAESRILTVQSPSSRCPLVLGLDHDDAWVVPSPVSARFTTIGFVQKRYLDETEAEFAFVEETPRFIGVRFNLGRGVQFGWIGVVRTGLKLDVFAWGYESVPGAPIVIPEPSALAMLGAGAGTAVAARRHVKSGERSVSRSIVEPRLRHSGLRTMGHPRWRDLGPMYETDGFGPL